MKWISRESTKVQKILREGFVSCFVFSWPIAVIR